MWAFGVVNGQFGGAAHTLEHTEALAELIHELEEHAERDGGEFDVNSGKDVYVQASYKLGGLGIFGSGAGESLKQTQNWRDNSVTLGGYYYRGTGGAFIEDPVLAGEEFFNNGNTFSRTGVSLDAWISDLNFLGSYQANRDRLLDGSEFDVNITTVEANYVLPWPWIQPGIRFEAVSPDFVPGFHRTTLSTTLMLRANVLVRIEGAISSSNSPDLPPFDNNFSVGLRIVF